jgi:drug/metabolite transporter (DMT)-like permease
MTNRFLSKIGIYPIILLSMIFWGMSFVWSTIVFRYYNPITTIFLRLILSSAILFIFIKLSGKLQKIRKEDFGLLFVSALFNPFFYFLGENFGLKFSSPTISAVIIATIPVFTPIAAHFFSNEKVTWMNITGILFSFVGIAVMLVNPDLSLNAAPGGVVFLLGAVASAIIYSVFLKRLIVRYSPLNIIAYQNVIGVVLFLPLFLVFELQHFLTVRPNVELIASLLQLSVFASSLAFIFFAMGVKQIGMVRTNVFSNLIPIFTAIFSVIFISENFSTNKIIGMGIVILGVILTQLNWKSKLFLRGSS